MSELSYTIGVLLGDGTIESSKKKRTYLVILRAKDRDFVSAFERALSRVAHKEPRPTHFNKRLQLWETYLCSKKFVNFLTECLKDPICYVSDYRAFIRGLFDSDGSVSLSISKSRFRGFICIYNSNRQLLELAQKTLAQLGIHSVIRLSEKAGRRHKTLVKQTKKNIYRLCIDRKSSIISFADEVGSNVSRKKQKLDLLKEIVSKYGFSKAGAVALKLYKAVITSQEAKAKGLIKQQEIIEA